MKNKKRILAGLLAAVLTVPLFAGSADTGCGVHTRYPLPSEQFFHGD